MPNKPEAAPKYIIEDEHFCQCHIVVSRGSYPRHIVVDIDDRTRCTNCFRLCEDPRQKKAA